MLSVVVLPVTEFPNNFRLQFWLAIAKRSLSRYRIVNRNWVTYFGIFLVLFCGTPARLKAGGMETTEEEATESFPGLQIPSVFSIR